MSEMKAGKDARQRRVFRSAERAFWWGVLRTERDRRLALATARPITIRNLRRLFLRRMEEVMQMIR